MVKQKYDPTKDPNSPSYNQARSGIQSTQDPASHTQGLPVIKSNQVTDPRILDPNYQPGQGLADRTAPLQPGQTGTIQQAQDLQNQQLAALQTKQTAERAKLGELIAPNADFSQVFPNALPQQGQPGASTAIPQVQLPGFPPISSPYQAATTPGGQALNQAAGIALAVGLTAGIAAPFVSGGLAVSETAGASLTGTTKTILSAIGVGSIGTLGALLTKGKKNTIKGDIQELTSSTSSLLRDVKNGGSSDQALTEIRTIEDRVRENLGALHLATIHDPTTALTGEDIEEYAFKQLSTITKRRQALERYQITHNAIELDSGIEMVAA